MEIFVGTLFFIGMILGIITILFGGNRALTLLSNILMFGSLLIMLMLIK